MSSPPERGAPTRERALEHVQRAARLAHIDLSEEETHRLVPQFVRILAAFGELAGANLEPLAGEDEADRAALSARGRPPTARPERPEGSEGSSTCERLLAQAPERIGDFFGVPKTVDREP